MNRTLLFLLFLAIPTASLAQEEPLSSPKGVPQIAITLDSLTRNEPQLPDSLMPSFTKIDSIRTTFNRSADSIQTEYHNAVAAIDAETGKINKAIDSLQNLQLPTRKLTRKLKALDDSRMKIQEKFGGKLDALKAKTSGKLSALDLPPEYKEPLQQLTSNIDKANLDAKGISVPALNIPGYSLPEIEGIGDIGSLAPDIGNMPALPEAGALPGVPDDLARQAGSYRDDLKSITGGKLDEVENLPETIEDQAAKIDGMDELQKQSGIVDEHKAQLDDFKDPEKAKQKAVEMGRKAAVDHFAGKQEQLKAAMEKISKYKQKYSSVSSIKDLPKHPPNPMKAKPFMERLVPGLYLQYQQKNYYLLDVNPYVGYKLSGRFTAGIGWNHRFSYDSDNRTLHSRSRIFGPRAYVDFKLGKGFIAHLEGETMNTFVPSTLRGNPDTGHREWVWSFMTGIKKEYRIYKNLKGTALLQYNLFNRYYKAPYVDRLNSRIGFEYTLKKKKKAK